MSSKSLLSNVIFSGIIQATNVVVPLLVFPYIISIVGAERFGFISIAITICTILNLTIDYSFSVTGVKSISENRTDFKFLSLIYSEIFIIRAFIGIASIILMAIMSTSYLKFSEHQYVFLFAVTILIGQIFSPLWFFQGIENFKVITILNFGSRILFLVLVLIYIKIPSDYELVTLFFGLGNVCSGIAANLFLRIHYGIKLQKVTFKKLKLHITNGKNIFISNISVILYMHSNVLLLSFFASDSIVGLYSIAERIIVGLRQILGAFSSATYPRLCTIMSDFNEMKFIKMINFYWLFSLLILIGSLILVFISNSVVSLFLKNQQEIQHVSSLLILLSCVPFIVALNIPANQILLAKGHYKECQNLSICALAICIAGNAILTPNFSDYGTCMSIILTECFITAGLYFLLSKKEPAYLSFILNKWKNN